MLLSHISHNSSLICSGLSMTRRYFYHPFNWTADLPGLMAHPPAPRPIDRLLDSRPLCWLVYSAHFRRTQTAVFCADPGGGRYPFSSPLSRAEFGIRSCFGWSSTTTNACKRLAAVLLPLLRRTQATNSFHSSNLFCEIWFSLLRSISTRTC